MMTHKNQRQALVRLCLLLGLAAGMVLSVGGCQQAPPRAWTGSTSGMLSAAMLASRLGLTLTYQSPTHCEMKNAANRVLVFVYENGRVYVNGVPVGNTGRVVKADNTYYFSPSLADLIRPHLKVAPPPTPRPAPKPRPTGAVVVIDPGHGGKDPGATSYLGNSEKSINLAIARKLAAILQRRGVQVVMTRQGDTFVELNDRADIANNAGADIFVSIHCDSHDDRTMRGFTVYIARSASAASRRLGESIENALSRVGIPSKGLRRADYRVLVRTDMPAVLVECGFLSNPTEAALLMDGAYQDKIAAAIAEGILDNL